MAEEIASLYAKIGADTSGFERGLDSVSSRLSGFGKGIAALGSAIGTAFKVSAVAVSAAAVGMATAVATTGIAFDDLKEKSTIAFTTMMGSGEKAQTFLNDLQAFAAKTPFEFPDLITASQRLMAMGFQADKVIPTMTAIGDAVAGLGGGAEQVNQVVTALGQMQAKGKTQAQEMMQLTEAGIPAWQMLADAIGVSIPDAMEKVTKGAVDAQTTINAVTSGMEKRFGGMMEKQSHTWSGLLSNVKDFFTQASGKVMKPFFDVAEKYLSRLVDFMGSETFTKTIDSIAASIQTFFDYLEKGYPVLGAIQFAFYNLIPSSLQGLFVTTIHAVGDLWRIFKGLFVEIHAEEDDNSLVAWLIGMAGAIRNLVAGVGSWFNTLISIFSITFATLTSDNLSWGQKLVAIWDMIYQVGQGIWTSLAESLSSLIPQWLNSLGEWASQIWQWIVDNTPVAIAKLGEWAAGLWGWLTDNLPTWVQTLGQWAVGLWDWIVKVAPVALAALQQWGSQLLGYLAANLPSWIATFFDWGTALFTWIGRALPDAINALTGFIDSLMGQGNGATSGFWTMVGEWAKAFWTWITDVALPQIAPSFAAFLAAVMTAGSNILTALGGLAVALGELLWGWIVEATPVVLRQLGIWWQQLSGFLVANYPAWQAAFVAWTTAAWEWIVEATPLALAQLATWAGALNSWLVANVPIIATLEQWGVGLWKWLEEAFGPFVDWLTQFATQFISWKDILTGSIIALGVIFAPTIVGAFGAILTAIGGFIAAWAPVLALFAGAIAAVALVRNAWEGDWGGIRTNTESALSALVADFKPLMDALSQFGGEALQEIIAWATGTQTNFAATQRIWEAAKISFSAAFDTISQKLQEWAKIAWDWFSTNFPQAAQATNAAVDSIKSHWSLFVEAAHPLITRIQDAWNALVNDWKTGGGGIGDAMTRLKNLLDNVWAIMVSVVQYSINTILDLMTLVVQLMLTARLERRLANRAELWRATRGALSSASPNTPSMALPGCLAVTCMTLKAG
jgi:tape measure domain-containing protein